MLHDYAMDAAIVAVCLFRHTMIARDVCRCCRVYSAMFYAASACRALFCLTPRYDAAFCWPPCYGLRRHAIMLDSFFASPRYDTLTLFSPYFADAILRHCADY